MEPFFHQNTDVLVSVFDSETWFWLSNKIMQCFCELAKLKFSGTFSNQITQPYKRDICAVSNLLNMPTWHNCHFFLEKENQSKVETIWLPSPSIYLHLIFDTIQFEILTLMNWIFFLVWTGVLQATQALKIRCKIVKKSSLSN